MTGTVLFLVACIFWGLLLTYPIKKEYSDHLFFIVISGFLSLLAVFQLICVPMDLLQCRFSQVTAVYDVVLIIGCIVSAVINFKRAGRLVRKWLSGEKRISPVMLAAVALILLQIFVSVYYTPHYWITSDDDTYVTTAVTTLYTDTMNQVDPLSGLEMDFETVGIKNVLTSYLFWSAWFAKTTGLAVTTAEKTLMPLLFVPFAYMIAYMIGQWLFHGEKKKTAVFLIFLSVINIFSMYSLYAFAFRLLVCIWQGKAVLAVIVLPFLFYESLQVFSGEYNYAELLILAAAVLAGSSLTVMSLGLAPMMIGSMALVFAVAKRRCRPVVHAVMCCIPQMIGPFIYLILMR